MNELLINLSMLFSQPTGISNYALNLFPHLKSLNPTLLTAKNFPNFQCYPVPDNLTPAQGSKGHLHRLLWTQLQLPKIYQRLSAKLLFSPLPEAPLFTSCRYVVQVHDLIPLRFPNWRSPLTNYMRYCVPQVLAQAQHIVCNSYSTARDITDFYGVAASKITPVLLAYDAKHFRPFPQDTVETSNNIPYFLYLGRQDKYKNLHKLLKAFANLPNYRDYQLWLAGPVDKRFTPILQTQIADLGVENQVKILDYVTYDELPKIISRALAFVFPSLWEGFGFPVLEAMACGTPVITSNLSSLPEVTGDAAILINPYNTEEITTAMQQIASDTQLQTHYSRLGVERAKQFSWEKTGLATAEVLKRFI
ncbi:MAG: glycosyltransferase family 4 protein [Calothrix sp. C42_A2020_038]|nr:glycosyltransferase family 4 protein [Calothrix sp. C42_A2020_038]